MGKGIASKLMQYVLEKFKGYKIYSCIAKDNIPSLKLHEKYGFKTAAIVTMKEVVEHLYNREYKGKIIIDDALKAAIDAYYEQYGVK